MNIYLVGYRCSGKTTLGRALAAHIGWGFVDMDAQLAAEQGLSIAEMVRRKGWPAFRAAERELLARLARISDQVVGTGGGVILDPANVATMRFSGKVIWLRCRPETIGRRMSADPLTVDQRPALTGKGVMAEIKSVLDEREPLYRAAADITVDTDEIDVARWCVEAARQIPGRA